MKLRGQRQLRETAGPVPDAASAFEEIPETREAVDMAAVLRARQPETMTASSAMHLQRYAGNRAVAGLLADPANGTSADRAGAYPHAEPIKRLLGRDVPGHAVLDSESARRSGVAAFTEGGVTHFADGHPPLGVAAHEAVHQFQNAGATNDLGLGPERHAAAVEHRVLDGVSAAGLLSRAGDPVPAARRDYTEFPRSAQKPGEWDAGVDLRVSADGHMAAEQSGAYGTHKLWASAALIAAANAALAANNSVIRLRKGAGITGGTPPDGTPVSRMLVAVEPENVATRTSGDAMEIWADCGRSARDVVGVGGGTGKNYSKITGKYNASGKAFETSASSPGEMADEIMKETLGGGTSAAAGWAKYRSLSAADREAFDRKTGINRYAAPDVGEGYTMNTGGTPFPGVMTWNFHWAGVVMRSGGDTVTLENYAVGSPDAKNTDWNFQMYGPASQAGQTFHDQHLASRQHGDQPTTIRVDER
jgi:hypothetical protein